MDAIKELVIDMRKNQLLFLKFEENSDKNKFERIFDTHTCIIGMATIVSANADEWDNIINTILVWVDGESAGECVKTTNKE